MRNIDYMRQWRLAHAEHLKAYRRKRYEANKQREIDRCVLWQQGHPVDAAIHRKVAAANRRYPGTITAHDIRCLIDAQGWKCCWCENPIEDIRDFTLEHLQPVNDPAYLAIACRGCNSAKLPSRGRNRRLTPEERALRVGLDRTRKAEYNKKWKQENRDKQNEQQRARYWANVEQRRAYFREWQRKKRVQSAGPVPAI